jgi:Tol biopolymer transport system component/DNA-binding winged helix-turn-helix (wHTH) protein
MENAVGTNQRVRFKAFELDLHTRELYRNGTRLRAQGQPIDVLEMLLEKPGELVTREQLRKKLWPKDTFVDFEHSLNSTIARLRDALGDRAEDPKFIETLPRLGYRFVAAVESEDGQVHSSTIGLLAEPKPRGWLRLRRRWVVAIGCAAAAGSALAWMGWYVTAPTLVVTHTDRLTYDGLEKLPIKTDGRRIYFVERVHGRFLLSQVSAGGGEISRIPSPVANPWLLAVAPDGSKLLVSEMTWGELSQAFWIVPLPSGAPYRLGTLEGTWAAWSSDGKRLIFAKGSELWMADGDGANPTRLLTISGHPVALHVSPDGERIRYTEFSASPVKLWEWTSRSGAHALLPKWHGSTGNNFAGAWSPDGRYYVFLERTPENVNIWVMPETRRLWSRRSATPVQLTQGPPSFFYPTFGLSNQTLFAVGETNLGELVRYDPDKNQVAPYLSGISAGEVAFSPDGQWIAYVTYPDDILWRCRVDGSDRQRLSTSGRATSPQWSPDSRSIAYTKRESGRPGKITIIPATGGNTEEADPERWNEYDANWSPDGTRMIFGTDPFVNDGMGQSETHIREVDLRTHRVTPIPGSKGLWSTRWSPDGRYLAALSGEMQRLMLFDFKRQLWTTWMTAQDVNARYLRSPVWSRDSRFLYFDSSAGEWRTRPGQHVAEKIMDLQDRDEPRYEWSTVGPDGAVYFTRDRSSREIYALHLSEK